MCFMVKEMFVSIHDLRVNQVYRCQTEVLLDMSKQVDWTEDKLSRLAKYLKAYSGMTGRELHGRTYDEMPLVQCAV